MAFDGIVTRGIAQELNELLVLGKIEKVYQPESDELVLNIHTRKSNFKLYISANSNHARIHLAEESFLNPSQPSAFCMLLRKHLQGGRIVNIEQKGCERIIEISLETINELGFSVNKKLIVEIMGKHSNIILVDANTNKILDSIKRISIDVNRVRQVLPGKIYAYPPIQDKIPFQTITPIEMDGLCQCSPDILPKELLKGIQGISPRIGVLLSEAISPYEKLTSINTSLTKQQLTPVVYLKDNGAPVDFHVVPLYDGDCPYKKVTFDTVSAAMTYYFSHKESSNRIKQKSTDLNKAVKSHLDKLYLKKQRLSEDLLTAENSDELRLFGELLTANIHAMQTGDTQVTVTNYYDGSPVTIPLDKRLTPGRNAQRYFKRYGKAKTAIKEKKIQLEENDKDIYYLESVANFIESVTQLDEIDVLREELVESGFLRKKKTMGTTKKRKATAFQYVSDDGFCILVGRNNKDNDLLTFKTAGPKDYWFHTKDIPGSHTILFTQGKQLTDTAIFQAASLAAHHSKGKDSENVPVDYTQVRYVKKPTGAKPGMVIFTHNKTVYVTPQVPESIE
ncbi:MAG: NFACT RNA binding domain-containing protein [Anaerovoracaceae bacterium]